MNSLLKFLGLAALIVFAGLWIMTVSKSCNKNKLDGVTTLEDELKDKVTEVTDDAETLFEGETDEEGLFDENGDEITSASTGTNPTTKSATTTTTTPVEEDDEGDEETTTDLQEEIAARENAEDEGATTSTTTTKAASSDGLEYLVIGGAFLTEANAKTEVKKLQKKGYPNAEVLVFDFSKYYSVCVERTENVNTANATKAKLIKEGHKEAYVHKKRSYKKK
jgi:hypothetical protein